MVRAVSEAATGVYMKTNMVTFCCCSVLFWSVSLQSVLLTCQEVADIACFEHCVLSSNILFVWLYCVSELVLKFEYVYMF